MPHGFSPTTVTNEPLFVDPLASDFRLQSNSTCINSGNNSAATPDPDLGGNPRVSGGTVDIGAYEFQNPGSVLSYAWAQENGLPTDGTADDADTDNDRLNNCQEWRAGTNPTNELSVLKMLTLTNDGAATTVTWQSVGGVVYYLEAGDLTSEAGFSSVQSNIAGSADTTSFTDTNTAGAPRLFYRVGVQ